MPTSQPDDLTQIITRLGEHVTSRETGLADLWDGGDVWGSMMAEGFALCSLLTIMGHDDRIPEELGYSMGAVAVPTEQDVEDDPELHLADDHVLEYIWDMRNTPALSPETVGEYLTILHDALEIAERAGLSY